MVCFKILLVALLVPAPNFLGCFCLDGPNVAHHSPIPEQKYDKRKEVRVQPTETKPTDEPTNDSQALFPREWNAWNCFKLAKIRRKSKETKTPERLPSPERQPPRSELTERLNHGNRADKPTESRSSGSSGSRATEPETPSLQEALLQCLMEAAKLSLSHLPAVSELIKKQLTCGATKIGEILWGQPQEEEAGPAALGEFGDYLFGNPATTSPLPAAISKAEMQVLLQHSRSTNRRKLTHVSPPSPDRFYGQKLKKSVSQSTTKVADNPLKRLKFVRRRSSSKPLTSSPPPSPPPPLSPPPTTTLATTTDENVISQGTLSSFIKAARLCFGLFERDTTGNLILAEDFAMSAPAEAMKLHPLGALVIGTAEAIVHNVKVKYDSEGKACYDINVMGLAAGLGWAVMAATPLGAAVKIGHIATTFIQRQGSIKRCD